jgi:hypothetical protein
MIKAKTLRAMFSFDGFIAENKLEGKFGDPKIRIITFKRQKKLQFVPNAVQYLRVFMIEKIVRYVIVMQEVIKYIFLTKDEE